MSATKLKCPSCGAPIPAKNINIQKMAAVCEECDAVFVFEDLPNSIQQRTIKAKRISKPERVTIKQQDDSLDLKLKWSIKTEWTYSLVIMGVWLAIALFIILMGVITGGVAEMFVIGGLLGAFPAYYFAMVRINSTYVRVENGQLHIDSKPLYFPGYGKKTLALDEIERIYAEPSHYYGMMDQNITHTRQEDLFYDVMVEFIDGSRKRLIEFFNYEQSFYIVQEVERYLQGETNDHNAVFEYTGTLLDAPLIDGELPLSDETNTPSHLNRG